MTLGFCLHIYSITICWTLALCQTHGNITLTKTGQGPLRFWWWKQHKAAELELKIGGGQEPNMSVCHRSRWETNTCRYLRARGPDTWCRVRDNADWVGSFPSTSWVTVGLGLYLQYDSEPLGSVNLEWPAMINLCKGSPVMSADWRGARLGAGTQLLSP